MRRYPGSRYCASPKPKPLAKTRHQSKLERLEPRHVLTSLLPAAEFGELSGYSGVCNCPICTGQGLDLLLLQEESTTAGGGGSGSPEESNPLSSLPQLRSNPAASAKLFLDFDGHFEATWGSYTNVNTPVFSLDGDLTTFSDAELDAIREIWARVAEDFAPFNIDVTTVDPGNQTDRLTAVIAIGGNYSDWYGSSAGGVAFIGGFYNSSSNVGYVFEDAMGGSSRYTAEAVSHEAGHLFGLRHQALWNGTTLVQPYYQGDANWAPIMGVAYYSARSTWYNGTTNQSPTSYQDDIAILAGTNNGFGQRADDHGNTIPYSGTLPTVGTSVNVAGLIEHNADVDMWRFTTSGGAVSFTLSVAQWGPNLDAILELRDGNNTVLYSSDPSNSYGASISATLAEGTYFLVARGNGVYGNIGQYNITGTVPGQATAPEISVFVGSEGIGDGVWINYGSTPVGTPISRTFTVRNDGNATLTLTSLDPGAMPAGYTLTSNLSALSLANGETATFTVRFDAASAGTFEGQIQIASNDANENPFRINVTGTATVAPEISLSQGGSGLSDGGSHSFGSTSVGTPVTRTFTITNDGNAALALTALDGGSMPAGFSLVSNLGATSLAPGQSTTFTIQLDATAAGSYSGTISLGNSDSDENPFDLTISGTVSSPDQPGPKLLDDGQPGWSKLGGWNYVTGKGRENDIYRTAKGSGAKQTSWSFENLPAGDYWVWASWTGNLKNASNAPYTVYDDTTALVTWRADQRSGSAGFDADGTSWKYMGTVTINSGKLVVRLTNAANGYVVSDAIRIDKVFDTSGSALPAGREVSQSMASAFALDGAAGLSALTARSSQRRSEEREIEPAPAAAGHELAVIDGSLVLAGRHTTISLDDIASPEPASAEKLDAVLRDWPSDEMPWDASA
jgi:hypothetical protein